MQHFEGIISLLTACIELVLIINLIIFSERNPINKLVIFEIVLLFVYQSLEFLICFFGLISPQFVYLLILDIAFLPPLGLFIVLKYYNLNSKYLWLIFLPALGFAFYYTLVLSEFVVIKCNIFFVSYYYPLSFLFGLFYYITIIVTVLILFLNGKLKQDLKVKKLSFVLFWGYILTFIPGIILALISSMFSSAIESLLSKFAIFFALSLSYFAISNRTAVVKKPKEEMKERKE